MNRNLTRIEEGTEVSPLEAGGKLPPTPLKGGSVTTPDELANAWPRILCALKSELASTACSTRLPDEYDGFFRDSWQVGIDGNRLVITADAVQTLKAGLRKYEKRIRAILRRMFGSTVKGVDVMTTEPTLEGEVTHA